MATHEQVAQAWAAGTGRARRGFNMWYDGATIYSYGTHFPIARRVSVTGHKDEDRVQPRSERTLYHREGEIVLITSRSYSVSTAKHVGIVWAALGYGHGSRDVLEVAEVMATSQVEHEHNLHILAAEAAQCREKASRARVYGQMHLDRAALCDRTAARYRALFCPHETCAA